MPALPFKLNQDRRHHIPGQKRKVVNWREYDESLRRRGSLTVWFSDEAVAAWEAERRTSRGGQPEYSDLAILTALTFKAVFRLAYRQTEGLIGSVIGLLGLDLAVPDHTTLCRRAATLEMPRPKPRGDGADSGAGRDTGPMHLLVDSTGLKLYGAGEWLVEKHGTKRRRSCARDGVADRLSPMPGERGPVLGARSVTVARHAGQVEQDREPRRALHQGADGRAAQPHDEVPLPVARHRPIGRLRRALADQDLGGDAGLAPSAAARPRHPERPPGAQASGQLAAQRPAALHVQRLVDGFVADPHGLIVREVEPQTASDLFRAPGRGPPPVLPPPVPAALPRHDRPVHRRPVRGDDETGEPVLHVPPQRLVDRQLGRLRTAGGAGSVPLGGRGPVRQTAAARGGVAAQLARDRGRRAL